jgi:asparagine synthase (glutamine-hydrolysing)
VEAHQSGRRDFSVILWTVLMFDAFLGQVLGVGENERQAA